MGTTTFIAMGSVKQSTTYKNEYNLDVTVLESTGDFYNRMDETTITFAIKYNRLSDIEYLGKK